MNSTSKMGLISVRFLPIILIGGGRGTTKLLILGTVSAWELLLTEQAVILPIAVLAEFLVVMPTAILKVLQLR